VIDELKRQRIKSIVEQEAQEPTFTRKLLRRSLDAAALIAIALAVMYLAME
jgi:hypothetical protein